MAASIIDEETTFRHVSDSSNKFCNSFYRTVVSETEGNIVSSPLSAHVILSLVAHGARSETAEEMRSGLGLPSEHLPVHEGFKSLISALKGITGVELSVANTMYIQEGVSVVPEFLSVGVEFFHSETPRVDFKDSLAATKQINSWVEKETRHKIKDLVSAGDIGEDTKLVLVNAIYFKGRWAKPFEPKFTESRIFHVTKDDKKRVPTMFKKFKYPHAVVADLNARIIEIPYVNEELSMLIILPNEIEGLQSLETNFDWETIEKVHRHSSDVELYLPRFKLETTINLQETLQKIGMKLMFSDLADFSGVANTPLKVGKVLQKAFIEVNEEGSEAAAATVVQMRLRRMIDPPETFEVNRPFMFAIQHKPSNIPLFVGSVRNIEVSPQRDEL